MQLSKDHYGLPKPFSMKVGCHFIPLKIDIKVLVRLVRSDSIFLRNKFSMKIKNKDTNDNVFIIAEIGNNHEGDFYLAKEMIYLAAEAGVDAVKFQTFKTESFVSSLDHKRFKQLKSFELSYKEFNELSIIARKIGLIFISTPLDIDSARFLSNIVDIIKISSGDNNFIQLLKIVSRLDKPIILSTGLMNIKQIKESVNIIHNSSKKKKRIDELAILHCVTSYPVEPKHANLRAIQTLSKAFDHTIGYSDHTKGINAAVSAVSLGARIIEKHFTLNKRAIGPDHASSIEPNELKSLVEGCNAVFDARNKYKKYQT